MGHVQVWKEGLVDLQAAAVWWAPCGWTASKQMQEETVAGKRKGVRPHLRVSTASCFLEVELLFLGDFCYLAF